jgi:hypothetical protein
MFTSRASRFTQQSHSFRDFPSFLVLPLRRGQVRVAVLLRVVVETLGAHRLGRTLGYAAAQAQHQVQRRLLLDIVVRERAPVLELLARKDEPLLVGRDALLVLDLALHHVDGVARLYLESDGLARQGLDKDLHGVFLVRGL